MQTTPPSPTPSHKPLDVSLMCPCSRFIMCLCPALPLVPCADGPFCPALPTGSVSQVWEANVGWGLCLYVRVSAYCQAGDDDVDAYGQSKEN